MDGVSVVVKHVHYAVKATGSTVLNLLFVNAFLLIFSHGQNVLHLLHGVTAVMQPGEMCAIMGIQYIFVII